MTTPKLKVLIARQDNAGTWQRVTVGRHTPRVGTSFPLADVGGHPGLYRQLELTVAFLYEEHTKTHLDLTGVDGKSYRVGPFF